MCIMAILFKGTQDTPILLAANREEAFARPTVPPKIQSGSPRVICGIDREAGGTWLGVNQYGVLATVANRRRTTLPAEPRSRGLLCRELLNFRTAREAAQHAATELKTNAYAGANYVALDPDYGAVVYGGDTVEIVELTPGLHTLSNGVLDDPLDERQQFVRRAMTLHKLDSAVTFLAVASRAFTRIPDPPRRRATPDFGAVSCSLVALSRRIQRTVFQHAPGPPAETPLDDLSALLRQVLSTERSRQRAQEEREKKQREKAAKEAGRSTGAGASRSGSTKSGRSATKAASARGSRRTDTKKTKPTADRKATATKKSKKKTKGSAASAKSAGRKGKASKAASPRKKAATHKTAGSKKKTTAKGKTTARRPAAKKKATSTTKGKAASRKKVAKKKTAPKKRTAARKKK